VRGEGGAAAVGFEPDDAVAVFGVVVGDALDGAGEGVHGRRKWDAEERGFTRMKRILTQSSKGRGRARMKNLYTHKKEAELTGKIYTNREKIRKPK
jgi:hypothetical protein